MSESEKESLFETIDWSLISEDALVRALDRNIIPTKYIAKAALNLCKKLRSTLNALQVNNHDTEEEEREIAEPDTGDEMVSLTPRSTYSLSPTTINKGMLIKIFMS